MRREEIDVIERSLSAEVLAGYYDKYATRFHGDYPHPRDGGEKFIDGLYEVLKTIGDGRIHDETVIYVPTSKAAQKDPLKSRYVITVSKKKNRRIFAIRKHMRWKASRPSRRAISCGLRIICTTRAIPIAPSTI